MGTEQYFIYESDVIRLAKSMTILVKECATYINISLKQLGYKVNQEDKTTWKYYMNLNGDYHESDPDPFMITSLDTFELIEYTKANLELHPVTHVGYRVGSPNYNLLVSRNPDHESLIRGITSPISFDKSLNSENYTILDYDELLLESNEIHLIDNLQQRVTGFFLNHYNDSYIKVDNLYLSASLAILYLNLPNMILNIRLANCFTSEVHSFHIWSHLASYGNLDRWRDSLDDYQQRYLYRNIRWINDNAGQAVVFNELTRVLLSRQNIPLYGYDLRHVIDGLPTNRIPNNISTRYRIDESLNVANFSDTKTIEELSENIRYSARDNHLLESDNIVETHDKMSHSSSDRVVTKVLELEQINEADSIPDRARNLAYYHWIYLCSLNKYNIGIELTYTEANINVTLSAQDALYLFAYCGSIYLNHNLKTIPDFYCYNIKKDQFPKREDLEKLIYSDNISDIWLSSLYARQVKLPESVDSSIQFYKLCYDLAYNQRDDILKAGEFPELRGFDNVNLLNQAFWGNLKIESTKESYEDFFIRTLINPEFIVRDNSIEIMKLIFFLVTGFSEDESGISSTLRNMTELMAYLSSYNVTFIYNDLYKNLQRTNRYYTRAHVDNISYTLLPFLVDIPAVTILLERNAIDVKDHLSILTITNVSEEHSVFHDYMLNTTVSVTNIASIRHLDRINLQPIGIIKSV